MYLRRIVGGLALCVVLFLPALSWAAHPLITDDTGTQGKGKFQLEVNGQYDYEKETIAGVSTKETGGQWNTALTYGIVDNTDIVLSVPHQWVRVEENGVTTANANGVSDTTLELKWRFYEKEGLSFALKPGIIMPTGDDDRGLGSGKAGYTTLFIATKEMGPYAFHANLGYKRNENAENNRSDLWHASIATVWAATKSLKLVADLGIDSNQDVESNTDPAYLLGGVIYSITENFDIDFGVKYGLTKTETDYSLLAGMTFRF